MKASSEALNSNNIIGKGSTFTGNIETYGNIRVEGRIVGDITSKSKVAIGPSASIEGNVLAQVAEVEGEVNGSLEITDVLILKPKCKVSGDINTNKLIVESGARFDGKCKMGDKGLKKIELGNQSDKDSSKNLKEAI
ncbi:MAG: polymer-forming cytoskeletal protein [Fulvivirga sp.]|nr:polymer-forming cytoskeletal protein [Fulvivirga sp.]